MALPVYATLAVLGLLLAGAAFVANRLRLPPALGYLFVGLAVSPARLGDGLLPLVIAKNVSELSLILILFFIGLELELPRLQAILGKTAIPTLLELAVTGIAVTGLCSLAFGWDIRLAAAAGLCASVSSTIFGDRLSASRLFPRQARDRILGVLLAEDIGSVLLLTLMLVIGGQQASAGTLALSLGTVLFFLVVLAGVALLVIPRAVDAAARSHVHEVVVLTSLGSLLLCAYAGDLIGSPELGAFLAGVAVAEAGSRHVVRDALASLREISLAVFLFVSAMLVDVSSLSPSTLGVGAAIAAVVLVGKLFVNGGFALAAREGLVNALRVGVGLSTLGEFSLVLVVAAEDRGIAHPLLRNSILTAIVLLLLFSSLAMNVLSRLPMRDEAPWRTPHRNLHAPAAPVPGSPGVRTRPTRAPLAPGLRRTASNIVLLSCWVFVAVTRVSPFLRARLPTFAGAVTVTLVALGIGVFGYGVFRGYRQVASAALRIDDRTPAGRARLRVLDAWVAGGCAMLLVPLALIVPASWPAAVFGILVALIIGAAAWRGLRKVHDALQESMERVLGQQVQPRFLEDAVKRHSLAVKVSAVPVPQASPLVGVTLGSSRLRELTGVTVAVLQRGGKDIVAPRAMETIQGGDVLVLYGDDAQLAKADALVVSHGEAIRLAAQTRSVDTVEVTVPAGNRWIGVPLASVGLKQKSGALVLGTRRAGTGHAQPFRGGFTLEAGDRLILLGTPAQLARARDELLGVAAPPKPTGKAMSGNSLGGGYTFDS